MTATERYLLSFTAASLKLQESRMIAEVYLNFQDWQATKQKIDSENLLQSRTTSRSIRTYQELSKRIQVLKDDELELLVEGDVQEQKYLLWFNVCHYYQFIHDFAVEVIHEKFLRMDYQLINLDYDAYFNGKADDHPELQKITATTQYKLKQVVFRMLVEAGITTEDDRILPALLSSRLIDVLKQRNHIDLRIYPVVIH